MECALSEARMKALIEGAFDERVTSLATAMAANREDGGTRPPAVREGPPGAAEETEDGFHIFNNFGKLLIVPRKLEVSALPSLSRLMSRTSPGSRSVVGRRRSSPVCAKLSMKAMAVEDNPHRYLDREIRYFDEQAAM
jgi:hypothetical protein